MSRNPLLSAAMVWLDAAASRLTGKSAPVSKKRKPKLVENSEVVVVKLSAEHWEDIDLFMDCLQALRDWCACNVQPDGHWYLAEGTTYYFNRRVDAQAFRIVAWANVKLGGKALGADLNTRGGGTLRSLSEIARTSLNGRDGVKSTSENVKPIGI